MCPDSLEMDFSSSFFQHFWRGDSRNYQDLARAACSVPRKADQAPRNSEFCWMRGPGTECWRSIGFDAFLLSFETSRVQCILVIRESFTKEYGSRVFHSSPCGPLFLHIEPNQLSLITRTHCTLILSHSLFLSLRTKFGDQQYG